MASRKSRLFHSFSSGSGSLSVITPALVPVAFVILLGVMASLALDFCLPALLFAATAVMTMKQLENWQFFLGIAIAVMHIPMPEVATKSLNLIGTATSGVALFALGLVLSGQRLHVGFSVVVNTLFKMLAQPAVMLLLASLLGVTGVSRREMSLLGALPRASMTAMFAVQYDVYVAESDATILLSTILALATLGVGIALTA